MINFLGETPRRISVRSCNPLNFLPVRKQPRLEVMECDVRVKAFFRANPLPHFSFRVLRRGELRRSRARIDIR